MKRESRGFYVAEVLTLACAALMLLGFNAHGSEFEEGYCAQMNKEVIPYEIKIVPCVKPRLPRVLSWDSELMLENELDKYVECKEEWFEDDITCHNR